MGEFNLNGKPLMGHKEGRDTFIFLPPFRAQRVTLIAVLLLTAHPVSLFFENGYLFHSKFQRKPSN